MEIISVSCKNCGHVHSVANNGWSAIVCLACKEVIQFSDYAEQSFAADGGDWLCDCYSVNPSHAPWCGKCGQPRHR